MKKFVLSLTALLVIGGIAFNVFEVGQSLAGEPPIRDSVPTELAGEPPIRDSVPTEEA